jgi:adenylate cyclase
LRSSTGMFGLGLAALIFAALLTAGLGYLSQRTKALQSLDYWTADWRSALLADKDKTQHPKIAVVLVDDDAVEGLPYRSPVDRGLLARLVDAVNGARAKTMGLDFLFDQATEPAKDQALLAAIARARGSIVIGTVDDRVPLSQSRRTYLQTFVQTAGVDVGHLNLRYELDLVVRSEVASDGGRDGISSFAGKLAAISGANMTQAAGRIAWLGAPADNSDTFLVVPAAALLANGTEGERCLAALMRAQLAGRIVIIGGDLNGQNDRHLTPLAKVSGEPMLGAMIHAHLVAQYLDGRRYTGLSPIAELAAVFGFALCGFLIGWLFPQTGFLTGVVPMVVLVAIDAALFGILRLTIPFAILAASWLAAVFFGKCFRWVRALVFNNRIQGAI